MLPRTFKQLNHTLKNRIQEIYNRNRGFQLQQKRRLAAHAHRTNYTMDKVYLRNEPDSQELHISFRYANQDLKIDRDFNFCRKIDEKIEAALNRIKGNIEKELNKKMKKGKKKTPAQVPEPINEAVAPGGELNIEFVRSNNKLEDVTFAEMLSETMENLHLKVLDRTFELVLNQPWVVNLVLPTSILAGFTVYPSKLEIKFAEKSFCKGEWYKAKMPESGNIQLASWQYCGDGLFYTTSNEDVDHYLKLVLTPGNAEGIFGPPVEHICKNVVQAGPGPCPFETRHCFTQKRLTGDSLRVVSYNILADLYADSDYTRTHLFPYCPPYALKIDYRKQLFIKEILGYNSDILCLQEVDMKIFDYDLRPVLEDVRQGFKGIIAQKGTCGEGVATFYRADKFELVESFALNIGENIKTLDVFNELWQKIKCNEKLVERICDRSTTLQLNLLKTSNDRYILVANTHLYFHPDADHIRLLQIGFAMLFVEDVYKKTIAKYNLTNETQLSIIFCGDFNSVPECGIYRLMTQGYVPQDFIDWSSNTEEAVKNVSLKQPFSIQSACGTPEYTNFTHAFAACLDYIFYQSDRFDVDQFIPLPSNEELKAHIAIPSVVFPSDHVALVADLKFKAIS
ncbi:2',5'-phosphodiesterase 12 [Lucilia sericata]|uniref:2',5'-phosphodiesterase 12 n=1 Tax=Lucilia sericata TaxID=13632 RepID=UPI0018A82FE2|nr:2',5'-phosphodiesterase 12 [Lucilia sericata]